MENTWLDKYTDSPYTDSHRPFQPKPVTGMLIGGISIVVLACMVAGSMWVRMRDDVSSDMAMVQLASDHSQAETEARQTPEAPAAQVSPVPSKDTNEEAFALQGVSDLSAHNDDGRTDPFAPIITGPHSGDSDPTKPKDILDNVSFTGFIGDAHAKSKDKVAIIEIGNPGGSSTSLVKKVGESFELQGAKVIVRDVRSNELYLTVGGARRTLELVPYVDTALLNGGGGSSGGSGSNSPNGTLNSNPLPGGNGGASGGSHEGGNGGLHLAE